MNVYETYIPFALLFIIGDLPPPHPITRVIQTIHTRFTVIGWTIRGDKDLQILRYVGDL